MLFLFGTVEYCPTYAKVEYSVKYSDTYTKDRIVFGYSVHAGRPAQFRDARQ